VPSTLNGSRILLWLGGLILEAGCLWTLIWSPSLTNIYTPDFTRAFFERFPWTRVVFIEVSLDRSAMLAHLEVGFVLMSAGYLLGLVGVLCSQDGFRLRTVLGFGLLARLTLLALPGLFSTDIFSYAMAGRISAVYQANPYVQPPADFPADPFLGWVFPFWRDTPTPYGPLWTDFAAAIGAISSTWSNFDQVLLYRSTLAIFELLTLWMLWQVLGLSQRTTDARIVGLLLLAWNPLWLFDIVGNAHNDVLMLLLLLAGIWFGMRDKTVWGIGATTLSALVKWTIAVMLPLEFAHRVSRRAQWKQVGAGAVLALLLTAALSWPWVAAPAAFGSIWQLGTGQVVINSVPAVLAHAVAGDDLLAQLPFQLLGPATFVVYFGWELRNAYRQPPSEPRNWFCTARRGAARALLLLPMLVSPATWSWYFSWSLVVAVVGGWNDWLTRLVVVYTLVMPPLVYLQQYLNEQVFGLAPVVGAVGPLILCGAWHQLENRYRQVTA
jgi:hypothetical protein